MVVEVPTLRVSSSGVALGVVIVLRRSPPLPKHLRWGLMTWLSRKMEWLRQQRGGMCEGCGSTHYLEFAHIRPTDVRGHGRGQWNRLRDIIRHPACYLLLCVDCHAYRDERFGAVRYDKEMIKEMTLP